MTTLIVKVKLAIEAAKLAYEAYCMASDLFKEISIKKALKAEIAKEQVLDELQKKKLQDIINYNKR